MIFIIALVVLLSAYFIANRLNQTTTDVLNARERSTMDALLKAKAALIAYAASEQFQRSMGQVSRQPGALPCPDTDDDGSSEGLCSNAAGRVGRLPWKTIGAEDLRDATGERLWYAVSSSFYKASGTTFINGDTQGTLTITGATPATNVVAVVFAPGQPIQGENRSGAGHNNVAQYLEGYTAGTPDFTFASTALASQTINDRLVVITQADVMTAVEPVVAARIDRNVKAYLQDYFSQWNAYPFPAKFNNTDPGTSGTGTTRPQTAYVGDTSQTAGLLPITDFSGTTNPYPWVSNSFTATKSGGTGRIDSQNCRTDTNPPSCTFRAREESGSMVNLQFQVQGQIVCCNAAISFAALPPIASLTTTMDGINTTFISPTLTGSPSVTGVSTVTYKATVPGNCTSGCSDHTVVVAIPNVTVSSLTSKSTVIVSNASNTTPITITTSTAHGFSTGARVNIDDVGGNTAANGDWSIVVIDATRFTLTGSQGNGSFNSQGHASYDASWFIGNEWYRQVYYAVSPGYLPGASHSCVQRLAPPALADPLSCLMVKNLPSSYASTYDKLPVVLILAGRLLRASPPGRRPSSDLTDYFEGINAPAVASPYVFENRVANVATTGAFINDRAVVIGP